MQQVCARGKQTLDNNHNRHKINTLLALLGVVRARRESGLQKPRLRTFLSALSAFFSKIAGIFQDCPPSFCYAPCVASRGVAVRERYNPREVVRFPLTPGQFSGTAPHVCSPYTALQDGRCDQTPLGSVISIMRSFNPIFTHSVRFSCDIPLARVSHNLHSDKWIEQMGYHHTFSLVRPILGGVAV
jgi:hypothetical protein